MVSLVSVDGNDVALSTVISRLSAWPDDQLYRVYRLLVTEVHDMHRQPYHDPTRLAAAEADAELFGLELVRRDLL